ncbi:nitrate ABC transporter [Pseudoalteromonas phenolica]|nr:nitrate ABC transporter [Pseudoalteromonas phenolica]
MWQLSKKIMLFIFILFLVSCKNDPPHTLRIAINPWPGYEVLHLAKEKGFFKQAGLNVELIRVASLADTQRVYLNNKVDGLTSTLIEAIQIQSFAVRPLTIALITDYSLGGDAIIAHKSIANMAALKGKTVGTEVSSLGIYVLQRGLQKHKLSLNDVTIKNVEQMSGIKEMNKGEISAYVTYPPISTELLKNPNYHVIFDSGQIPKEVVDIVSISQSYLKKHPETLEKLWQVWQLSYEFIQTHPDEAMTKMAKLEGLDIDEFAKAFSGLEMQTGDAQSELINHQFLNNVTKQVCETLWSIKSIDEPCGFVSSIFFNQLKQNK